MSARDELWQLVNLAANVETDRSEIDRATDAILAAGYSKPRVITTVEELDALPGESVVRDQSGMVYELDYIVAEPLNKWWITPGSEGHGSNRSVDLPATVLHEGN